MSCEYVRVNVGDLVKIYYRSETIGIVTKLYYNYISAKDCAIVCTGSKNAYLFLTDIEIIQRIKNE